MTYEEFFACELTWSTPISARPSGVGEACNLEGVARCRSGSVCSGTVCRALCNSNADCDSGRCVAVVDDISVCADSARSPGQVSTNPNGAVGGGDTDVNGGMVSTTVAVPEWTIQFGNAAQGAQGLSQARAVHVNRDGSIVIVGQQSDGASVDDNIPDDNPLPGGYVRKYSPQGALIWEESFGLVGDSAHGVDEDPSGNLIVSGNTYGLVTPLLATTSLLGVPFVRKYDSTGSVLWTRQFEEDFAYTAYAVSVDAAGNIMVVGDTQSLTSSPEDALFLRKYDPAGNVSWTRQLGSRFAGEPLAVTTDSAGNVLVAARVVTDLDARHDALLRKYDPAGDVLWSRQFGTAAPDLARSVAVDAADNVLVVGTTDGALPGQTHNAGTDAYVRKYDPAGNELWTRQFGTAESDIARVVSVDAADSIVVAGYSSGVLSLATGEGRSFVRKYDADGDVLWTQRLGMSDYTSIAGLSVYDERSVVVAGQTRDPLPGAQLAPGGINSFVIMLAEATSLAPSGTSGDGTSSGGTNPGSTAPGRCSVIAPPYPGQPECRNLLDEYVGQIDDCTCPSALSAQDGEPPVTVGTCTRDLYVSAALAYCWAAECYSFLGVTQAQVDAGIASFTPASAAIAAFDQLENADELCSEAPVAATPQTCPTLDLYPCGCDRGVCP